MIILYERLFVCHCLSKHFLYPSVQRSVCPWILVHPSSICLFFPFINPSIRLLIYPSIICARAPTSQCRFASIRLSTPTPYLHTVLRPYLPSLPIYIVASTYLSLPNHHLATTSCITELPTNPYHTASYHLQPHPTSTSICLHLLAYIHLHLLAPTYVLSTFIHKNT